MGTLPLIPTQADRAEVVAHAVQRPERTEIPAEGTIDHQADQEQSHKQEQLPRKEPGKHRSESLVPDGIQQSPFQGARRTHIGAEPILAETEGVERKKRKQHAQEPKKDELRCP